MQRPLRGVHNARPARSRTGARSCNRTSPGIVACVFTGSAGDIMGALGTEYVRTAEHAQAA
jgi:hypothetical protein